MIIKNYTFDASAKTITFNNLYDLSLEGFVLISNVTDGIVIYQCTKATKSGTLSGNVLTLNFDTTGMSDSDDLMIVYESPADVPTSPATEETLTFLKRILTLLKPLGIITGAQSNRLSVDVNAVTGAIASVTTVTTVASLTNIVNIGSVSAFSLMKDNSRHTYANSVRTRLT